MEAAITCPETPACAHCQICKQSWKSLYRAMRNRGYVAEIDWLVHRAPPGWRVLVLRTFIEHRRDGGQPGSFPLLEYVPPREVAMAQFREALVLRAGVRASDAAPPPPPPPPPPPQPRGFCDRRPREREEGYHFVARLSLRCVRRRRSDRVPIRKCSPSPVHS
jgi:hypothetical protein